MARITPLDIRKQEFKKSSFGFSREQVTHYLEQVADEVEELIRENNELRKEYGKLREKLSSYRNVEQSMNEALVLAKDSAKKTLVAAQKESELMLLMNSADLLTVLLVYLTIQEQFILVWQQLHKAYKY